VIADQDVDATELLVDRTKEGIDVRRPGQVSLENETKLPIFARIGCMLFRIRPLAVLDTDDRAGVRENFGKGPGPMYWDTPVISATFPSSRIAVLLLLLSSFAAGVS
jgi:hypothetical protein